MARNGEGSYYLTDAETLSEPREVEKVRPEDISKLIRYEDRLPILRKVHVCWLLGKLTRGH